MTPHKARLLSLKEINESIEFWEPNPENMVHVRAERVLDILATARAAMRVVENVKVIDDLLCLSDRIYTIRESEGQGWEGPKVVAYGKAVTELEENLKPFLRTEAMPKDEQTGEDRK